MTFDRVIFGVSRWSDNKVCSQVAGVARAMAHMGIDVRILVDEPERSLNACVAGPADMIVHSIPHAPHDRPADAWLSVIRYLEENAPCVYVSNQDWNAALATPRLSNRVAVIGVLHEDRPEEYDHCARLGRHWNAIIALDAGLRQRIIGEYPELAARLVTIDENRLADEYGRVIAAIAASSRSGLFRRSQRKLINPPLHLVPGYTDREIRREVSRVNAVPVWPDWPRPQSPAVRTRAGSERRPLRDHRIVLAVPTGRVSGVDVFSINLARALIERGYDAEIVQTAPDASVADRLPMPSDIPVSTLRTKPFPTWRERWAAMRSHLEERGPCIYLPNYDNRHSCVIPTLSRRVKVVGIGHSDDAQHYAHILHLAPYWDAVIGVSQAVSDSIAALAPGIEDRQWTIPYGVVLPPSFPARESQVDDQLRAIYTGRIVRFQKRALDLLSIAQLLQERGTKVELTVAGTGTELMEFLGGASSLFMSRHIRFVGGVSNDDVLRLVASSDVFVLPSSFEGLPISLLEAMAQGCVPVVSGIRSGVPDILRNGENGFVVPIGGISHFAERISELRDNPALLERLRRSAYETVRNGYTIDKMTASYLEVFEKILAEPYERPSGKIIPPPGLTGVQAMMPRFPMPIRRVFWSIRGKGA